MATTFTYNKTTITKMKVCGILDVENMTIDFDGEPKKLLNLLADFDELPVEITVGVREKEELEEPTLAEE